MIPSRWRDVAAHCVHDFRKWWMTNPRVSCYFPDFHKSRLSNSCRLFSLFLPLDAIEWNILTQTQRTAGATKYDPATEEITISLTWDTYDSQGWEQFSSTVRHELIHAWQYHKFGEADHGRTFDRWTDDLDTTQHCERFTSPNWWVICEEYGGRLARYQRSKVVKHPEKYSCGDCGGALRVEEANE